jgi:Rho-binding antiterminator
MENTPYTPIDCAVYDVLEVASMRREILTVYVRNEAGEAEERKVFIDDLWTRNGEEFMRLHTGEEIRLDRLVKVDSPYNEADSWAYGCSCK